MLSVQLLKTLISRNRHKKLMLQHNEQLTQKTIYRQCLAKISITFVDLDKVMK